LLEWALAHLCRYCDSDFFPRAFKFDAIREIGTCFKVVPDEDEVRTHAVRLRNAWEKKLPHSPYVNEWMCHVLANPGFNRINLPADHHEREWP